MKKRIGKNSNNSNFSNFNNLSNKKNTLVNKKSSNSSNYSPSLSTTKHIVTTPNSDKSGSNSSNYSSNVTKVTNVTNVTKVTNVTEDNSVTKVTKVTITPKVIINDINNISSKNKILLYLYEQELCVPELIQILKTKRLTIQTNITRKDQNNGLLEQGLIEITKTEGRINYYTATNEGKGIIDRIIKKEKETEESIRIDLEKETSTTGKIDLFTDFLHAKEDYCLNCVRLKEPVIIDFNEILAFNPGIAGQLLDNPEETFKIFGVSFNNIYEKYEPIFRIKNLPDSCSVAIGDFRTKDLNKFIKVKGVPVGATGVTPQSTLARFECPSCGSILTMLQNTKFFRPPSQCACGRKGKFKKISEELKDIQILRLEECSEEMGKRTDPQTMAVMLDNDLTEIDVQHNLEESKKLVINGVLEKVEKFKGKQQETNYDLVLNANYVQLEIPDESTLNEEDKEKIKKFAKNKNVVNEIITSFAPNIVNVEIEKEGLLLSYLSGGETHNSDWRDDSHILLIGDPAVAKSALLEKLNKIASGSRWISGKTSSAVGLIGTTIKDEQLGVISVSKGVLPMSNGKVAICDELDKMNADHRDALHEALERQKTAIHKWNKHVMFTTDMTFIAAMNPKLSRFTDSSDVLSQIDLPPTLISRFDLIFVMRDKVDEKKDSEVAKSVSNRATKKKPKNVLSNSFLKKYLEHARTTQPEFTEEADKYLDGYYVKMRKRIGNSFSARQLEGAYRLAKAHAKLRLSNKVKIQDGKRAIFLLNYSLRQISIDEDTGEVDVDIINSGISGTQRTSLNTITNFIKESKEISVEDLFDRMDIEREKFDELIAKLKRDGDIFESKGMLKIL